ncbi:hypothetical protein KCU88_g198, partial [Aureobasidium melanogenum]
MRSLIRMPIFSLLAWITVLALRNSLAFSLFEQFLEILIYRREFFTSSGYICSSLIHPPLCPTRDPSAMYNGALTAIVGNNSGEFPWLFRIPPFCISGLMRSLATPMVLIIDLAQYIDIKSYSGSILGYTTGFATIVSLFSSSVSSSAALGTQWFRPQFHHILQLTFVSVDRGPSLFHKPSMKEQSISASGWSFYTAFGSLSTWDSAFVVLSVVRQGRTMRQGTSIEVFHLHIVLSPSQGVIEI